MMYGLVLLLYYDRIIIQYLYLSTHYYTIHIIFYKTELVRRVIFARRRNYFIPEIFLSLEVYASRAIVMTRFSSYFSYLFVLIFTKK